jgi:hypothetical protein
MYLQKVIYNKNFVDVLKVTDENMRDPDPDPLVRGMDPRIRIRIKISWIRNTNVNMFTFDR